MFVFLEKNYTGITAIGNHFYLHTEKKINFKKDVRLELLIIMVGNEKSKAKLVSGGLA